MIFKNEGLRKCGLILETGCSDTFQEPKWFETLCMALCLKSQDVGSNPITRKNPSFNI